MIHVIICSVLASWGVYSILCCIAIAYIIEDKCFAGDGGSVYSRLWHGKGNQADSPPTFYDCFADFKKKFHWLFCSAACQRWKKQSSVDKPYQNRNFFPVKRRHVDRRPLIPSTLTTLTTWKSSQSSQASTSPTRPTIFPGDVTMASTTPEAVPSSYPGQSVSISTRPLQKLRT